MRSTHSNRLQIGGATFDPETISLEVDEDRVPYGVMRATLPLSRDQQVSYINNGGCEDGTGPEGLSYTGSVGATVVVQDSDAYAGRWALRMHPVGGWTNNNVVRVSLRVGPSPNPLDLEPGSTWTFSTMVRTTRPQPSAWARMIVRWYPAGGGEADPAAHNVIKNFNYSHERTSAVFAEGAWSLAQFTVTVPPAVENGPWLARVWFEFYAFDITNLIYLDDLRWTRLPLLDYSVADPRTSPPPRVHVSMTQAFGYGRPLSDLSADYAGGVLADLEAVGDDEQLLFRAGFEDGLDGFEGSNPDSDVFPANVSTLATSTAHAHTGAQSVQVTPVSPTDVYMMFGPAVPVDPGRPFYADLWAYWTGTGIGAGAMLVEFFDAAGAWVALRNGPVLAAPPAGEWFRVRGGIETPDDPAIATARLVVYLSGSATAQVWFDDVEFRRARAELFSLTTEYGRALNASGVRPSTRVRAKLYLAAREIDHAAGTVTMEAYTDDGRLNETALTSRTELTPAGSTVRDCVNMVLGHVLGAALPAGSTGGELVEPGAVAWQPGETAWSYLSGIIGMAGLRLWCDLAGAWHLEDPELTTAPGQLVASPLTATELTDQVSREDGGWGDGAVVTYEWTDTTTGDRRVAYDAAGVDGGRTITRTVNRAYPGAGLARGILRRARALGRVLGYGGVGDYSVRPYQPVQMTMPDGAFQAGIVSAVTWSQPDDTMTVRTRDLLGIDEHSYLYTPPGVAYDDVPAGTSYFEYAWEG